MYRCLFPWPTHMQRKILAIDKISGKKKQILSLVTDEPASDKVIIFRKKANQKDFELVRIN